LHSQSTFVIIQIGSHFESRNTEYLRAIINQLIDAGVVPILGTKADNRELDHRVNRDLALLAAEFNLPLWNFWAALTDIPDRGLFVMDGREEQGAIYLDEEATDVTACWPQMLNVVCARHRSKTKRRPRESSQHSNFQT
jgi:hypothetical protein